MMNRVLIVDMMNLFFRAYSTSPATDVNGIPAGGVTGSLLSMGSVIRLFGINKVYCVFDGKGGSARRRGILKEYKADIIDLFNSDKAGRAQVKGNDIYIKIKKFGGKDGIYESNEITDKLRALGFNKLSNNLFSKQDDKKNITTIKCIKV